MPRVAQALLWVLALLILALWLEPAGSYLSEPDELRYAEIPREMIASGDFVTPRLNAIPYLEKTPLLYWANAASMRLFGLSPWAARLPNRLAGLGTAVLLGLLVGRLAGPTAGLAAAVLFLGSPLGFILSRLNLTDGLLTFFFTALLLLAFLELRRAPGQARRRWVSPLLGLAAAGGFLTKGAVAVVLPGLVLFLWCLATGRLRSLFRLALGPATPIFVALSAPWLWLMEQRHPGFLRFFFVREHFERFATTVHEREEPVYFFLGVFLLGFVPGLGLLVMAVRRLGPIRGWPRRHSDSLFFLIWIAAVLGVFSASQSKLVPYILPAIPAAAAFVALSRPDEGRPGRVSWALQAVAVVGIVLAAAGSTAVRQWMVAYHLRTFAVLCVASLVAGSALALVASRRSSFAALAVATAGWAGFYLSLVLAYPRTPYAQEVQGLGRATRVALEDETARFVSYRTFINGIAWDLRSPVTMVEPGGEIGVGLRAARNPFGAAIWSREEFWRAWRDPSLLVVLARESHMREFESWGAPPTLLARGRRHFLLANHPVDRPIPNGPLTAVSLYTHEPEAVWIPMGEVPTAVLDRARAENAGRGFLWATREQGPRGTTYELATGGRFPRALELTETGRLVYVEQEIHLRDLPRELRDVLGHRLRGSRVLAVMKESRRTQPASVVFEICLSENGKTRVLHFDAAGRAVTN